LTDADVHLLFAGTVGDRDVVLLTQGSRLIALHQPFDRGWVVGEAQEAFDPFVVGRTDRGAVVAPLASRSRSR
jgi:hypothetical protein